MTIHSRGTSVIFLRLRKAAFALGVFSGMLTPKSVLADNSETLPFSFGESCEQLFDLVDDELRLLTSSTHAESFARLCVPEWPNTCDDYSSVLAQFGEMHGSPSDYFCHFTAK